MRMTVTSGNTNNKVARNLSDLSKEYNTNATSDGYVSFPDFENFHRKESPFNPHREHNAVKT